MEDCTKQHSSNNENRNCLNSSSGFIMKLLYAIMKCKRRTNILGRNLSYIVLYNKFSVLSFTKIVYLNQYINIYYCPTALSSFEKTIKELCHFPNRVFTNSLRRGGFLLQSRLVFTPNFFN